MATEIKTRILLRNDSLAAWQSNDSVILKKGEVGIAMLSDDQLAELRVGNDTKWSNSYKLRVEAGQISGLIDTINTQVSGIAQEYSIISGTGDDLNKWFLQTRPISGGSWTTVSTIDLGQLTGFALSTDVDALVATVSAETLTSANGYTDDAIDGLSDTVDALVGNVSAETLVSANAYTDEAINGLSIDNYMLTSTFNEISTTIGLDRANANNPVVTSSDIAALDNVMHFKGVVAAVPTSTEGYEAGDIVLVVTADPDDPDNGKEFVLVDNDGTKSWEQIGDQNHNATQSWVNATVNNVSVALSTDYVGKIGDLETSMTELVASTSAATYTSAYDDAKSYTDEAIEALSIGDYATKAEVNIVSTELSTDYVGKIGDLSTATEDLIAEVSVATYESAYTDAVTSANSYTDDKIAELSISDTYATKTEVNDVSVALSTDYVGKIGNLETSMTELVAEVSATTYTSAVTSANSYTDDKIAELSIDDYIKHGEVVDTDLSGFFVFDCGGATYRTGEEDATEA